MHKEPHPKIKGIVVGKCQAERGNMLRTLS